MADVVKDLGVKIGTKREAWWTNIKNKCEDDLLNRAEEQIVNKAILEIANKIIAEEQSKK